MMTSARLSASLIGLMFALAAGPGLASDDPVIAAIPDPGAVPSNAEGRSAYGLYLAGRSALSQGEAQAGAAYLASAQALTPDQAVLREQAFTSALLAGDLDLAARIAPTGEGSSPVVVEIGRLVGAVRLFGAGDARAANAQLKSAPIAAPHARAGLLVAPWIAASAGDWDRALATPTPETEALALAFGRYQRAQLLEIRRRYPEAEAELQGLSGANPAAILFNVQYGEFLERRGRQDEALAVYDAALAANAGDQSAARARARLNAGGAPPPVPTLTQGASRGLATAAAAAAAEQANVFAVVYLRLSLGLYDSDEVRGILGQTLQASGLGLAARAALDQVQPDRPELYAAARLSIAYSLQEAGMPEAALAEARRAVAATPADPQSNLALAGLLIEQQAFDEALTVLNGPVLNTSDQPAQVRYLRGAAYESTGRVPEAEAELWTALQAAPNDATLLNYLGYLWVDSGTRIDEGAEMIARAAAAQPEDGNIQDSLGWARYRQGQFDQAVEILEEAVEKEPGNAEINDHLGDAYWRVGRQREAGFQWNRVLTLEPDDERRDEAIRKLAEGLDRVQVVAVAANP